MVLPKVQNCISSKGNVVPNQFVITTPKGYIFQSYSTIIAYMPHTGKIQLDENSWDCSVTTGRYRNDFLGEGIKETRENIDSGKYLLKNLN